MNDTGGNQSLWIEREGRGPALVMLHGWGLNLRVFDALSQRLSDSFERIRVDLPGHGRSHEPADLERDGWSHAALAAQLLAALPARFTLLGWSLGAQVAIEMAAAAPARVDALLLVSATPRFAAAPDWPWGAAPEVLTGFARQLQADYRGTVRDFLDLQVRGSRNASETLIALQAALFQQGECPAPVLARSLALLHGSDLRARLAQVRARTLVLAGQYDRVVHPGASRALAAALPRGSFHEIPRCGHAPFLSHEDEFAVLLRDFVLRADAATPEAAP
jgi:pimeloyl-[acyl-carrier protein] methyl ester esterase